jgi:membrane fusion protein, multidrug efflux system
MKRAFLLVLLLAVIGVGYYFRGAFLGTTAETRAPQRPSPAQTVVAAVATEEAAPILVTTIGTVQSISTVIIKSRVDGEIAKVHFDEGQEVNEGDILFTLDNRAFAAQLVQSEANLDRNRAQLVRAQAELKRQTDLASRGVASAQKLEEAQAGVAVLEAAIRADQAAIENARVNLNYTTIRAPIAGRTGAVNLKRGNVVKSNDTTQQAVPLVTITQLRPIYVSFTLPEKHLTRIRAATTTERLPVNVTLPNEPQEPIAGKLTFVDNQVDVISGTITLKATFDNDDARLWPGQFVNVTLTLGVQTNALLVPSGAIQIGQNGPYVFVIKPDSTVELRLVRIDRTVKGKTVIAGGLASGERVVTDGQLRLSNGTRVAAQQAQEDLAAQKQRSGPIVER